MAEKFAESKTLRSFVMPKHHTHNSGYILNAHLSVSLLHIVSMRYGVLANFKRVRSLFCTYTNNFLQQCQNTKKLCKGRKVRLLQAYCLRHRHILLSHLSRLSTLWSAPRGGRYLSRAYRHITRRAQNSTASPLWAIYAYATAVCATSSRIQPTVLCTPSLPSGRPYATI